MRPALARGGQRLLVACTIALGLVALGWAAASLTWPYQVDHGAYAWIGRTIVHGGMPYVNAWDVKGPMASLPFALTSAVLGDGTWAIRLFDLILVLASAWAIRSVVRAQSGDMAATITALAWILAYATLGFTDTAQPDGWVGMGLLLAVAPAFRDERRIFGAAVALGAVTGLAMMVKPFYLLFLLPALVLVWPDRTGRPGRMAAVLVAFVIPVAAIVGWFAVRGALADMLRTYIGFNTARNSAGMWHVVLDALSWGVLQDPLLLLLVPAAAAGIARVATQPARQRAAALALLLLMAAGCIIIQRPYYAYRTLALTPVLFLSAGLAWPAMSESPARALRVALGVAVLLLLLRSGREPLSAGVRAVRLARGEVSREHYDSLFAFHDLTAADEKRMARWVDGHTAPQDSIFVWTHVAVLSYAHRAAASRLILPVGVRFDLPSEWRMPMLAEIERDLARQPPIIIVERDSASGTTLASFAPIRDLPNRGSAFAASYAPTFVSGSLVAFARP